MASTNKTTNYELSQFLGSDKPAWLTDYNADMSKIDAGIHTAQTTATGADGKADAAATAIGTLANLTTEAKTSAVAAINEVDSHADTAQNTANTALTNAGTANTNITSLQNYLALTNVGSFSSATTNNGSVRYMDLYYASNNTGSLGKVYGQIDIDSVSGMFSTITLSGKSPFRPETEINILAAGVCSSNSDVATPAALTIQTDGTVLIKATLAGNTLNRIIIHPCVLFIEDFGDIINQ